jgi:RNA 2',3'-cyclic 3'-phosphodiesterase
VRLFVAVEVPEEGLARLRRPSADVPAHVTIRFLGETDPERLPTITDALAAATRGSAAIPIVLEGMGAFPDLARPRVVWVGIGEGATALGQLASRVSRELERIGYAPELRAFVPHVTLLRIRNGRDAAHGRRLVEEYGRTIFGTGEVRELLLKESLSDAGRTVHRPIGRFALGGDRSA